MIFLRITLIQLLTINCCKIERKSNKCAMQYTNEKHYSSKHVNGSELLEMKQKQIERQIFIVLRNW